MMDLNKTQRHLMAAADEAARRPSSSRRRIVSTMRHQGADQEFCSECYAVMENGDCPRCTHQASVYLKFCRQCLRVHLVTDRCEPWTPVA